MSIGDLVKRSTRGVDWIYLCLRLFLFSNDLETNNAGTEVALGLVHPY